MIKRILAVAFFWATGLAVFAQERMPQRVNTYTDQGSGTGFLQENLFVGGSLALGFGSYNFNAGVSPEIGYSLNQWLDAGVVLNFNYNSERADLYYNNNTRTRTFNYGGGVFGRAYVLPFLFLTAQPEFNWVSANLKQMDYGDTYHYSANAGSLLLGAGYGQRVVGQSSFYIALMFDVLGNVNSPYNDQYGHPLPVIRGGFNFYLHGRR